MMWKTLSAAIITLSCVALPGCSFPGTVSIIPVTFSDVIYDRNAKQVVIATWPKNPSRWVQYHTTKEVTGDSILIGLTGKHLFLPEPDLGPLMLTVVIEGVSPGNYKVVDKNFPSTVMDITLQ